MKTFQEYAKERDEQVSEGMFDNQPAASNLAAQQRLQNLEKLRKQQTMVSPYAKAAAISGKPNQELSDAEKTRIAYEKMKQGTGL